MGDATTPAAAAMGAAIRVATRVVAAMGAVGTTGDAEATGAAARVDIVVGVAS